MLLSSLLIIISSKLVRFCYFHLLSQYITNRLVSISVSSFYLFYRFFLCSIGLVLLRLHAYTRFQLNTDIHTNRPACTRSAALVCMSVCVRKQFESLGLR